MEGVKVMRKMRVDWYKESMVAAFFPLWFVVGKVILFV